MKVKGFTLIELLIVIGILAAISAILILLLNPTELISQGRDSRRLNDLKILNNSIDFAKAQSGLIDNSLSNLVYTSLPDTNSNPSDNCGTNGEYSLPALISGWQYRCVASSTNLRKVDGNGWIPINFNSVSNKPLNILPVDPVNDTSNFYTFTNNGDLTTKLNSQKYIPLSQNDGGNSNDYYETRPIVWVVPSSGVVTIKSAVLPSAREFAPCARNSSTNKIYCFGGDINGSPWQVTQIVEYTPATDTMVTKSAVLPFRLAEFPCAENSATNKIYCFGGGNPGYSSQIWEYTPATDTIITKSATLPGLRGQMACAEDSSTHKIYCFGGYTLPPAYLNQIVEYTPATDTLVVKSAVYPFTINRSACTENSSTHKIYCFGGSNSASSNQIVEYTPATDAIVTKSAVLPSARNDLSCAGNSSNHKIYCLGGFDGWSVYLDQIVEYTPATDTLITKSVVLPNPREGLSCTENLATNKIYCFGGGGNGGGTYLNQIIEYLSP